MANGKDDDNYGSEGPYLPRPYACGHGEDGGATFYTAEDNIPEGPGINLREFTAAERMIIAEFIPRIRKVDKSWNEIVGYKEQKEMLKNTFVLPRLCNLSGMALPTNLLLFGASIFTFSCIFSLFNAKL